MNREIQRILVYTHNSIGLGHAFRTLAVITGIRKWRPDIDFLVMSSTSIPQIFFEQGIELIKLPSVKIDIDSPANQLKSRYLSHFDLETIFDFRQRIILETFDFFRPQVLVVEHNMTGQMSELIPVLMKKWMRKGRPGDFTLVHMCRGIMKWIPLLEIPYENPRHRSESINLGQLYDLMYVLEDREVIDINKAFLGDDPELETKIRYLGKVTNKTYEELPERSAVFSQSGLPDRPTIVISLGRNAHVPMLMNRLLESLDRTGALDRYQVLMVVDPYLDPALLRRVHEHSLSRRLTFLKFRPSLVDLIRHADLVVARAGYNTVNEILLTGARAILIPEQHGSGEQEQRARSVPHENIEVLEEQEALQGIDGRMLQGLLDRPAKGPRLLLDKYRVGKAIIEELEAWQP